MSRVKYCLAQWIILRSSNSTRSHLSILAIHRSTFRSIWIWIKGPCIEYNSVNSTSYKYCFGKKYGLLCFLLRNMWLRNIEIGNSLCLDWMQTQWYAFSWCIPILLKRRVSYQTFGTFYLGFFYLSREVIKETTTSSSSGLLTIWRLY